MPILFDLKKKKRFCSFPDEINYFEHIVQIVRAKTLFMPIFLYIFTILTINNRITVIHNVICIFYNTVYSSNILFISEISIRDRKSLPFSKCYNTLYDNSDKCSQNVYSASFAVPVAY